ncbi:MAG: SMC-Scp complex subunit ScpB [Candidatus Kerfeldbacteria bacterium CG_4_10_14_0_8_um_filter_42_10]|uniref:SMC-Scp complex subunit ScpB n=1 Tax=Candidatus Kerfeldbacteria bacterium CG_4_10_14_0_8_um_filter_42_10 TaxID=2014248 RepID=A0A2M7RH12_9BACT|nr:MAG: SMC-Scp complex subunit ScpB [Candidatus Kerfeldbacteria bacterium CG_4_10_14_0_8_um_filter_42_10]
MSLSSEIETILFIASRPLTLNKITEIVEKDKKEVEEALKELVAWYDQKEGGIKLMRDGSKYELVSNPQNAKAVRKFLKDELTGELTKPSLETLSIIAYRGPVTKGELETIRGVNCSLIIRNLLIRGLIESEESKQDGLNYYQITFDFLRHLGVSDVKELPDFDKLNRDHNLEELLKEDKLKSDEFKT